jgi:hypothetical protein
VLTFGRSVQVDGGHAMQLDLDLKRVSSGGGLWGGLLCALLGLMVGRRK